MMEIIQAMLSKVSGGIEQASYDMAEGLTNLVDKNLKLISIIHHDSPYLTKFKKLDEVDINTHRTITVDSTSNWTLLTQFKLKKKLSDTSDNAILISHGRRAASFLVKHKKNRLHFIFAHNDVVKHLKMADYVIAVSNGTANKIIDKGVDAKIVKVVPNVVRVKEFTFRKKAYHKPLIVGSMGRFVAKKGFDDLIIAFRILKDNDIDVRLILGGAGEEEDNLKALINQHKLEDYISLIGWINDKDKFLNSVDVFCLPSRIEHFGIVLIEAMAKGIPVISTRCDGPLDIILNDDLGVLVDIAKPDQIAKSIEVLMENPEKLMNMAKNAHNHVIEHYDINHISKEWYDIFSDIINNN